MASSSRKGVKRLISGLIARLWRKPDLTPEQILGCDPQRILIVRQHNQMGDMVCATPSFRALREAYPRARMALVCSPVNRDVVLHNPHLDEIFIYDKRACRNPMRLLDFLRVLRRFRPDLAFVLNSVSFSVTSAAFAAISGADAIVGGDSRPFGYDISRHAFSLEMPSRPELDRHAVEHCLAPLAAIGIDTDDLGTVVTASDAERARAAAVMRELPGEGPLWVMHPGAGKVQNLWPADRFAELALLAAAVPARVLVLQGPADAEVTAEFESALHAAAGGSWPAGITLAPPSPVGTCVALLESADRFLCNDTGLTHVAGAVGVPTLALFGPTDPELWLPRAANVECLRGADGDLASITAAAAWARWRDLKARGNDNETGNDFAAED